MIIDTEEIAEAVALRSDVLFQIQKVDPGGHPEAQDATANAITAALMLKSCFRSIESQLIDLKVIIRERAF